MTIYFAYGSNLDTEQIRRRCPSAHGICTATLAGYRLAFTGRSGLWGGAVATIEPDPDCTTWGALYTLSEADSAELDRWEGAPHAYERIMVDAITNDGQVVPAVTYRKRDRREGKPTAAYVKRIRAGYKAWGLPSWRLEALVDVQPAAHLVAVYGSLLSGLGNHRVLARHGAELVAKGRTFERLEMASFGSFPAVRKTAEGSGCPARVEVYSVTDEGRDALDRLEGHPRFYRRSLVRVATADGQTLTAWCYLCADGGTWSSMAGELITDGDWRGYVQSRRKGAA